MPTTKKTASKSTKAAKAEQKQTNGAVIDVTLVPDTPAEKTPAERTQTVKNEPVLVPLPKSPAEIIHERYGFGPDQTNIPKLLYALLCEAVAK